jgi:hypothetical protein
LSFFINTALYSEFKTMLMLMTSSPASLASFALLTSKSNQSPPPPLTTTTTTRPTLQHGLSNKHPIFTASKADAIHLRAGLSLTELPPTVTVLVNWAQLAYPTLQSIGKVGFKEGLFLAQEHRELRNIGAENALKPVSKVLAKQLVR